MPTVGTAGARILPDFGRPELQNAGMSVAGPEAQQIQRMFAGISQRYDRANRVLSGGLDQRWRRAAVLFSRATASDRVLDICAGTGDLAQAFADTGARVTGSDFCQEMLVLARQKGRSAGNPPRYVTADSESLPFADAVFDVVSVAFGIRNVHDPLHGLREMRRVARPGGRVVVLEFCRPRVPVLGALYRLYLKALLPRLGTWITGDRSGAYQYLHDSVMVFPEREQFLELMASAGLVALKQRILTLGIAALYLGEVPA